jgi:urease alpha subunit
MQLDAQTCEARSGGMQLTSAPAAARPIAQRCFLF